MVSSLNLQEAMMSYENVDDDSLSSLPEEMVAHILSLMPTKFAVQTSILSKRWRCKWMSVTSLDFEDIRPIEKMDQVQVDSLTKFVDHVLKVCETSQVKLFRLHFPMLPVQKLSVSKWIDEAVRLKVLELDIHVKHLGLPLSMFTCKTLTKLRLNRVMYDDSYRVGLSSVYLPCLKTLEIVGSSMSFVDKSKLIHGCPVLESLSLEVPRCYTHQEDYIFNIPTLRRLKLTLLTCCLPVINNRVVLNLPNLEYLFVDGNLFSLFEMEDVSSLVEASFSFRDESLDDLSMWVQLLKGISRVKSLSIQHASSLKIASASSLPPMIFPNMKQLELKGFWHSGPIFQFLESSPELTHLYVEKLADSGWIESKRVPACMLRKLTSMKLSICKGQKQNMEFLKYMLANAEVLKKVTISWENSSIEEVEKLLFAKLLKFLPKASRCCEFHIHDLILPAQAAAANQLAFVK